MVKNTGKNTLEVNMFIQLFLGIVCLGAANVFTMKLGTMLISGIPIWLTLATVGINAALWFTGALCIHYYIKEIRRNKDE